MNYQLTLDSEVQWAAERLLEARVKELGADSAFAIVLDVRTGELLALANAPGFDANHPQGSDRGTGETGRSPSRTSPAVWRRC